MPSTFDWTKSLINSVSESILEIDCLIIINSVGGVMEHKIAENHKNESDYRVEKMARKISL